MDTNAMLKRIVKDEIVHLLETLPGAKDMIIEESLMKPLDRMAGITLLREHGVEKIFKLEVGKVIPFTCSQRIYLVRSTVLNTKFVADNISSMKPSSLTCMVIFVPRKLCTCEMILEHSGLFGQILVHELNLNLIPIDDDLLSLEMPQCIASFFLDNSIIYLYSIAKSLWHFQTLFGPIPNVYAFGRIATMAQKLTEKMFWEFGEPKSLSNEAGVNDLLIFDRELDFATVFLSCLTHEALLDETFGINCGFIDFPSTVTKEEQGASVLLSGTDAVYNRIRDLHFSTVYLELSQRAKHLQTQFDKRNELDSVAELKNFVATELRNFKKQHRTLVLQIGACEAILNKKTAQNFEEFLHFEHSIANGSDYRECCNYIEDLMCQQVSESIPLGLLCLLSIFQNGLPTKDYNNLRHQYLQAYGHKYLVAFHNLAKLSILFDRDAANKDQISTASKRPTFQALRRKFKLYAANEDIDLKTPSDLSYVYNGAHIPLICQLVQIILETGFNEEELSKSIFSPMMQKTSSFSSTGNRLQRNSTIVYFVGGVTYAEIACLRLLGKLKNRKFIIATTNIINRSKFLHIMNDM